MTMMKFFPNQRILGAPVKEGPTKIQGTTCKIDAKRKDTIYEDYTYRVCNALDQRQVLHKKRAKKDVR